MDYGRKSREDTMLGSRSRLAALLGGLALCVSCGQAEQTSDQSGMNESSEAAQVDLASAFVNRLPEDEIVYFVLPDRFENGDTENDTGGFEGGPLDHGFDPTAKGFYNGGDLKGLTSRLDYIKGMGATAIWLGPIYKNKPVQGPEGDKSAGYHGYWITDFTLPDPHLGSEDDLKAFVDGAHERGMKVYLDIITNHTADVIKFRECADPEWQGEKVPPNTCPYRSLADYPYTTRGDTNGESINEGFMGDRSPFQTAENFDKLTRNDFAYTPYIPAGEENAKTPAWLNDIRYYHNRGDTTFEGESSLYGDFVGLDDLMTEDPFVVQGFIDIYKDWITKYRMDGFRIDTARHVNPEFWHAFNPAMIEHAESIGIPNFYIFGEVYDPDPAGLARFTRVDKFPTVLDFGFQSAVQDVLVNGEHAYRFDRFFKADALYEGNSAAIAPVFVGNHDMGRFAGFLRQEHPEMSDQEMLARVRLAHAIMMFARGVPVIYYGDEQGFVSDGNDQLARENMFPSQVTVYNDNDLLGTNATTAESNFDTEHPLYVAIAEMSALYHEHDVLRRGKHVTRWAEIDGGILAFSRVMEGKQEAVVIVNTRPEARNVNVLIDPLSHSFTSLYGACASEAAATGTLNAEIGGLEYMVCLSNDWSETQ